MASPSPSQALKVPGRLCINPTNLSAVYPHGGTAMGLVKGSAFQPRLQYHPITGEERGGAMVDAISAGHEGVFVAVLDAWDKDAVIATFLNAAAGSTTGRAVWKMNESTDGVRAGALASGQSAALYFSPIADQHPGVLFYKAIPMPDAQSALPFSLSERFGVPMVWRAVGDDDGDVWEVGLREDLTL